MTMIEDTQLVRQLKRGSTHALRRIYDKYRDQLLKTSMVLTGDKMLSEDVVQDVFIRLIQTSHRLKTYGSFRNYLITCVINRIRTLRRDSRRHQEAEYIQTSNTNSIKPQNPYLLFRTLLTRVAIVAVLILLIAVVCNISNPFSESVAWADVQKSFSEQACLHCKIGEYPYETEFWVRLYPPQIFMKGKRPAIWEFGGGQEDRCYVMDFASRQKWTYNSLRKTIVTSSLTASEQEEEPADYIHYAQNMAALLGQGELYDYDVVVENDNSGRETRFQLIQSGIKLASISVDDSTHLPTYIRVYQDPNDSNVVSDSYQDVYFDYPPISPTSIRDLGVSEDIPVIKIDPPEPELQALADAHDSARGLITNCQGMSFYRTSLNNYFYVGVFQSLGEQGRVRSASLNYDSPRKSKTVAQNVDSFKKHTRSFGKWTENEPLEETIFPAINVPLKARFRDNLVNWTHGQWKCVYSDDPSLSSAIGLQFVNHAYGKALMTWWLDPEHDYWVCGFDHINVRTPKHRESSLIIKLIYRVKSFARTSEGKWYPSRIERNWVQQNGDEREASWDIYLEELPQSDTTLTRDFLVRAFSHLLD